MSRNRVLKMVRAVGFLSVLLSLTASRVDAGASKIPNQSTRAMGMSDAFVGGADDASAVYYNPAGLTNLDRPQFIGNLYYAHSTAYYSGADGDATTDGRHYFLPTLYYSTPLTESHDTAFGLGIYSPFGLGGRWGDDVATRWARNLGAGSTVMKTMELQLVNINPVLAHNITDDISVAAGVNYYRTQTVMRGMTNYVLDVGEIDFDAEGHGWGYNLGFQWRCADNVSIGLTLRSDVKVKYKGSFDRDDIPTLIGDPGAPSTSSDAEATVRFPLSLAAGVNWKINERWRCEFAAEWMEWNRWDELVIETEDPNANLSTVSQTLNYRNSWILMLGTEFDLNEKLTLRAGYSFNETPVRSATADVILPFGDVHVLALGAGYDINESVKLDVGVNLAYGGKRTLYNSGASVNSDFEALSTYVSLGLTYTF